ncbi:MAG: WHG domain-containing protein [Clostridia bacterium]|nr:WHG domain-containing protein [Clostridia bacterium]
MARAGLEYAAVIRAAADIADAEGMGQVTLASVAAALQVRTPSLYNHVEGLPGLRRGLALYGVRELGSAMGKAAMGRSGAEAIRAVCHAYVGFVRARPGLYEACISAPDPSDAALEQASREVVDILLRVLAYYRLEGEQALHVVRGLRSLVHGFASLESKGGFGLPLDRTDSLEGLISLFIAGLHALYIPGKKE